MPLARPLGRSAISVLPASGWRCRPEDRRSLPVRSHQRGSAPSVAPVWSSMAKSWLRLAM